MAQISGIKCDVCNKIETGHHDLPPDWLCLKLPGNGGDVREMRDICSDKCLLTFAKARNGSVVAPRARESTAIPGLGEYFESIGLKRQGIGPKMRVHVNARHDMNPVEDCPVCQFETEGK